MTVDRFLRTPPHVSAGRRAEGAGRRQGPVGGIEQRVDPRAHAIERAADARRGRKQSTPHPARHQSRPPTGSKAATQRRVPGRRHSHMVSTASGDPGAMRAARRSAEPQPTRSHRRVSRRTESREVRRQQVAPQRASRVNPEIDAEAVETAQDFGDDVIVTDTPARPATDVSGAPLGDARQRGRSAGSCWCHHWAATSRAASVERRAARASSMPRKSFAVCAGKVAVAEASPVPRAATRPAQPRQTLAATCRADGAAVRPPRADSGWSRHVSTTTNGPPISNSASRNAGAGSAK